MQTLAIWFMTLALRTSVMAHLQTVMTPTDWQRFRLHQPSAFKYEVLAGWTKALSSAWYFDVYIYRPYCPINVFCWYSCFVGILTTRGRVDENKARGIRKYRNMTTDQIKQFFLLNNKEYMGTYIRYQHPWLCGTHFIFGI